MNSQNIEKILKFVQRTGEKFIVVFGDGEEPVVLMPFHLYEAQYENIHSDREIHQQVKPLSPLTTASSSDTMSSETPQSLEKKPEHIREVLKERSQTFPAPVNENPEAPSINSVPPEDRYYFEPIE